LSLQVIMEVVVLLLLSAVAQLVGSAPSPNLSAEALRLDLKRVIDGVQKFNKSFANEYFVEDVSDLVDAGCKVRRIFCHHLNILHKHEKFEHSKDNEALVNILKHVLNKLNVNCTEFVKTSKPSVTKPIPVLLENLKVCSQKRNTCLPGNC
uniref:Interleukin-4 n=1 Tax=Cyprinodon variegatus TaxID=28743 RepID=A0A3Q2E6A7_CYPVA